MSQSTFIITILSPPEDVCRDRLEMGRGKRTNSKKIYLRIKAKPS